MKTKLEEVQSEVFFGGYNTDKKTIAEIKAAVDNGEEAFTAKHETTRGLDKEVAVLAFEWSKNKQRQTWRETEVTITKPDGKELTGLFKFPPTNKYKAKEMYNMMHGRSVRVEKAFFTKDSKTPIKYFEWDTLNLNQKTDANEYPIVSKKFNGFDRELDKLNAIFVSADDRDNFKKDLEKGNVVKRKVIEDGKMVDRYFQANPIAGEIVKSAKADIGQNVAVVVAEDKSQDIDGDKKKVGQAAGTAKATKQVGSSASRSHNNSKADAQRQQSAQKSSVKNGESKKEAADRKRGKSRKMA